tara:strand:- start:5613 stop:7451 length:1839 start_codon:yes stop_codon:yes gene_type:complete
MGKEAVSLNNLSSSSYSQNKTISNFGESRSPQLDAWLKLVCQMIPQVQMAYVGVDLNTNLDFREYASWPNDQECEDNLCVAAKQILQPEQNVENGQLPNDQLDNYIATHLNLLPSSEGVVVLKVASTSENHHKTLLQLLEWSEAWLNFIIQSSNRIDKSTQVVELQLIKTGLSEPNIKLAATAMAVTIAQALKADRVSIGCSNNGQIELVALSNTANFDSRTHLNKNVVAAMVEAIGENNTIAVSSDDETHSIETQAHRQLCSSNNCKSVCTALLKEEDTVIGAITLEFLTRQSSLSDKQNELDSLSGAVAKVIALKQLVKKSVYRHLAERFNALVKSFSDPNKKYPRLVALGALAVVFMLCFVDTDLQVAAPATLEGRIQQSLVAPIDGYIAEAPGRAGDALKSGDVLAMIDTSSLMLERRRRANELAEYEKSYRKAIAGLDRAEASIMKARRGRVASQLALIDEQLSKTTITAPFDGMVISGDLSRSLGSPVSRGDVLFEMAPLDDYRVVLEIDERDISEVAPGQRGYLALSGLSGDRLPIQVEKIVAVAENSNGRNIFKVEAKIDGESQLLRPGMRGVGKIVTEQRSIIYVWTRHLIDRINLWFWKNVP